MNPDEAKAFLRAWRDDDHELPIPNTVWGRELAAAVDVLIGDER